MLTPRQRKDAARLATVVGREVGGTLSARLMPVWIALLFGVVQFWTIIPWDRVHSGIAGLSPVRSAGLGVGLQVGWMLAWGPTLRTLLVERPALRPWWRSGLAAGQRGLAVAPVLLVCAAPMLVAALFWPVPGATLVWRAGVAMLVGMLLAGRWRVAALAMGALAVAAEAVARTMGMEAGLVGIAMACAGAIGPIHARSAMAETPARRAWIARWRPRTPLGALVWRDFAALARTAPELVRAPWVPVFPLAVLVYLLRVRGGLDTPGIVEAMGVCACVCAPLGGAALGRVRVALGDQLFVRRWPPGAALRGLSLLLVALATFLPTGTALAATTLGSGATLAGTSAMVLAAATCAAGAVLLAVWRPGRVFNTGWHLGWVLLVLLACLWGSPAARVAQAVGGAGAYLVAVRRLAR
jgi:hypothetical protein